MRQNGVNLMLSRRAGGGADCWCQKKVFLSFFIFTAGKRLDKIECEGDFGEEGVKAGLAPVSRSLMPRYARRLTPKLSVSAGKLLTGHVPIEHVRIHEFQCAQINCDYLLTRQSFA